MKKWIYMVLIVIMIIFSSSLISKNSHIFSLESILDDGEINVDILYQFKEKWDEQSRSFILTNGKIEPYTEEVILGIDEMVPINRLEANYSTLGFSNYEKVRKTLGQYVLYDYNEHAEIFVFYKHNDPEQGYQLNVLLKQNETIQTLSYQDETMYLPVYGYRSDQYYYIIEEQSTKSGRGLIERPIYRIKAFDLKTQKVNHYDFVFEKVANDGILRQIIIKDGNIYALIDERIGEVTAKTRGLSEENSLDSIIRYNFATDTQEKITLSTTDGSMIFFNDQQLMYGYFESQGHETVLVLKEASLKGDTGKESRIALPLENAMLYYGHEVASRDGLLYTQLIARPQEATSYYLAVIDLKKQTLLKLWLLNYEQGIEVMSVRYVDKKDNGYHFVY